MRFVVTGEWGRNRLLQTIVVLYVVYVGGLWVTNLLDTRNVVGVYSFTGSPADDGYLASGEGQQAVNASVNPVSFVSLYTTKMANPNLYTLPRRIQLGARLDF